MAGFDLDRLERVRAAIQSDVMSGAYFGASVVVSRGSTIALSESFGNQDRSAAQAVTLDSVFPLMSISKSLTAVVVIAQAERGLFQLTTCIADVIPEFGANGKSAVTVAQLLSHTSGLGEETPPGHDSSDAAAVLDHICKAPLRTPPGHFGYSGESGYFILAEFLERLDKSRRSFCDIVADILLEPLRMTSTAVTTTPELRKSRVPITVVGNSDGLYSDRQLLAMERAFEAGLVEPGGSYVSTAGDLHRFAIMLLEGGCLDGVRVLSPAMIRLATTNHTGADEFGVLQHGRQLVGWPALRANYGLGFQMRGDVPFQPIMHGSLASAGAFGHRGAGLTCFWVDPITKVSFVCLTAGFLEESRSVERWQRLSDMVHAAVVD